MTAGYSAVSSSRRTRGISPKQKLRRFAEVMQMFGNRIYKAINISKTSSQLSFRAQPTSTRLLAFIGCLVLSGAMLALAGCGGVVSNKAAATASAGSITASPATVAFGSVTVGSPATTQVSLVNSSAAAVVVSQVSASDSTFSVDGASTFPITVAAKSTTTLNVRFTPTATGAKSGQLVIQNNSLASPSVTVQVTGTGLASTTSTPTLTVNASSIAFGSVVLNTPSTQSLTLSSTGAANVVVSSVSVSGAGFTVSGATFPLTLTPGQSATLSLQFQPTAAGAASGKLVIASNSTTNATATIALSGTGVPVAVDLSWTPPGSGSIAGFNVYRATGTSSSFQRLNAAVSSPASFMDSTVLSGTTYQYYVTSVDSGGAESIPSNTATIVVP